MNYRIISKIAQILLVPSFLIFEGLFIVFISGYVNLPAYGLYVMNSVGTISILLGILSTINRMRLYEELCDTAYIVLDHDHKKFMEEYDKIYEENPEGG